MTSLSGSQVEPKARLGLDHTGPHPSLFLWSPLTRAAAGWFMVSQVPGTKVTGGDAECLRHPAGAESLLYPELTQVLPP